MRTKYKRIQTLWRKYLITKLDSIITFDVMKITIQLPILKLTDSTSITLTVEILMAIQVCVDNSQTTI